MKENLFTRIKTIQSDTSLYDIGGGSPIEKCYLMAYLAITLELKTYVEIGVYRGRSLFTVAEGFRLTGGEAYGIDPFSNVEAAQNEIPADIKELVSDFIKNLDFEQVYNTVLSNLEKYNLNKFTHIIRKTSSEALPYFNGHTIDMLHIDGNHDYHHVKDDLENYAPLVNESGIIILDDINWPSVRKLYDEVRDDYIVLLEAETFSVLMKIENTQKNIKLSKTISAKIRNIYENLTSPARAIGKPTVAVGVITFNHEKYITQCLESIVSQKGEFNLKVIIADDHSTDKTTQLINEFISKQSDRNIQFECLPTHTNMGMTKNLERLIRTCQESDYIALIDGDDYWINDEKLNSHIDFLEKHPECAMSFDSIQMHWEETKEITTFGAQQNNKKHTLKTQDIIQENIIGTISCCFYTSQTLKKIPDAIFDMFTGDWMLNIACSELGDLGHIRTVMTCYRKHNEGIWSGMDEKKKTLRMISLIDQYNLFFNYKYDACFSEIKDKVSMSLDNTYEPSKSIIAIDDVFPHPVSGFRYQEFTSYLEHFDSFKILTSGQSVHVLGNKSIDELITDYKIKNPTLAGKISKLKNLDNIDCSLLYFVFLVNAQQYVHFAEARGIPFIFTLYPGGAFGIDNTKSDEMLKRVTQSPCFRKVIVSQKNILEYLLDKKFCRPEQIEYVFGVVTPLDKIERTYDHKKHYGFDKECLDICFVAHKYTSQGQDKGYDIFIETAKKLANRYNNINFHVVGNFDESVIDVSSLEKRICFHGIMQPEEFVTFYKDKDIILSANINGLIYKGSFDGFPTASCTDASLCKVAIFCTDPLKLNDNKYINGKEIVIIKHDSNEILKEIEYYYEHPDALRVICEEGYKKTKKLYNYDNQIKPRIDILTKELATAKKIEPTIKKDLSKVILQKLKNAKIKILTKFVAHCPTKLKKIIKSICGLFGLDYRKF